MIAVLFGPPGSGKGTQAAFMTSDFQLAHVSTGDMLRAEAGTGSALGREVAPLMAAGKLVPDELIVRATVHPQIARRSPPRRRASRSRAAALPRSASRPALRKDKPPKQFR